MLSGFTAAVVALPLLSWAPPFVVMPVMLLTVVITGALWIGAVGALRHYRGINETIASLLMFYIAVSILNFFVEGVLRDPAIPTSRRRRRSARPTWSARSPDCMSIGASPSGW